jgi:hypothetical protein
MSIFLSTNIRSQKIIHEGFHVQLGMANSSLKSNHVKSDGNLGLTNFFFEKSSINVIGVKQK